jgi:hypothetical protein
MPTATTSPKGPIIGPEELFSLPDAPETLSLEDVLSVIEAIWVSPELYMETFLVIQTKGDDENPGALVKLRLNRTQRDILAVIKDLWRRGEPVRLIILKARQEGVSTFIEGLFFSLVVNNPNTTMWVISHDRGSSENLFGMSERYLDKLPVELQPMVRNRDRKRIRFDNPDSTQRSSRPGMNSRIYIDQAKNVNAGRSDTITFLHISERAFWGKDGRRTITSLLQAVPSHAKTIVVQESTANGVDDPAGFYEDWMANYGNPRAKWRCLFFPWFIHDEYQTRPHPDDLDSDGRLVLREDPDGEMREDWLRDGIEYVNIWGEREMHPLTDEQLAWRRWAIDERCRGDIFIFMQEFPSTPTEAFVQSGRPWWNRLGMEAVSRTLTPPIATGTFVSPRPDWFRPTTVGGEWREDHYHRQEAARGRALPTWSAREGGEWWLWRLPEPGREYLVSVDTAEGGEDGSRAAIQIFDRRSLEQVAEYNGYIDTDLLAHQAAMACHFYNMAFCIPEVNNTGYGFMNEFPKLWSRTYFRRDPDAPVGAPSNWQLGFKTTSVTRPLMVTRGANYVREQLVTIHSTRLYGEMLTFTKDSHGIPRASGKAKDDLVMAFLMMLELAELRPVRLEKEKRPITLADDKSFQEHMKRMKNRRYLDRPRFF